MSTKNDLHILFHSLGFQDDGSGREYRNYYAAEPGDKDLEALVASGDMTSDGKCPGSNLAYYRVTSKGKVRVYEALKALPKPTRSQRRYREYLHADCGESFGEWLKRSSKNEKAKNQG